MVQPQAARREGEPGWHGDTARQQRRDVRPSGTTTSPARTSRTRHADADETSGANTYVFDNGTFFPLDTRGWA